MNYSLLGKRLREERLKSKLTQEKLAEVVDVSHAYIGQIERAERSVTLDTLIKIANQLGVTVDDLLRESLEISEDHFVNRFKHILIKRSPQEQQMALEMVELMFSHLDALSSNRLS